MQEGKVFLLLFLNIYIYIIYNRSVKQHRNSKGDKSTHKMGPVNLITNTPHHHNSTCVNYFVDFKIF